MDTDGRLLLVNLTTADLSDSAGEQLLLDALRQCRPWLKHLFGDGAYDRMRLMDKAALLDFTVEVVRRLVRDYEQRLDVSQNMIYVAMGTLLLQRIT